jgi:hypothetical protein
MSDEKAALNARINAWMTAWQANFDAEWAHCMAHRLDASHHCKHCDDVNRAIRYEAQAAFTASCEAARAARKAADPAWVTTLVTSWKQDPVATTACAVVGIPPVLIACALIGMAILGLLFGVAGVSSAM